MATASWAAPDMAMLDSSAAPCLAYTPRRPKDIFQFEQRTATMSITHGLGLTGPEPVIPGTMPLGESHAEDARFATLSHGSDASGALAELRLTQMQALQQRFRNDLQSVCSLASLHGSRAEEVASEAGFQAVGRRAMALAALYDELLCSGAQSIGTMARIRAGSSHIGAVWLSRLTGFWLPLVSCALNPSDSGFTAPSISGLFAGLPGVCTNL